MNAILFKWVNVFNYMGNNQTMSKAFTKFYNKVKMTNWQTPNDIIKTFNSADLIVCPEDESNRFIFIIGGNKYRMVCSYKFGNRSVVLYIKYVGTHSEYDKINICKVNMFKK